MERELFTKLERWMKKKNRKPLIIHGGKTGRQNMDHEGIWSQIL